MVSKQELQQAAIRAALRHGIDPQLFQALIHYESNWNPWTTALTTVEYYQKSIPSDILPTERWMRSIHYGLTQISGQAARELGFKFFHLAELYEPENNCEYACIKLAKLKSFTHGDISHMIELYNPHERSNYYDAVMQYYDRYK